MEGGLGEGQTVLIHGGTGGIGTTAIQLARELGARVLTSVGSEEGVAQVRELGADLAWNRRTVELREAVLEAGGADLILDIVGGSMLADNVAMLRQHGRLVIIGTLGGADGGLPVGMLTGEGAGVSGARPRSRPSAGLRGAVLEAGGADLILDIVGGSMLADNVAMLRQHGRLVIIGTLGGADGELPVGMLMGKRARVIGTTLRSRPTAEKAEILERTRELVWPLLTSGSLHIPVHARLPLERAAEAHAILREGGHLGKVVLEVTATGGG